MERGSDSGVKRTAREREGKPCYNRGRFSMTTESPEAIGLLRRTIVESLAHPVPEVIRRALLCLTEVLDVPGAFLAKIDSEVLEIIDAVPPDGTPLSKGMRMPLNETFAANQVEPLSVADADALEPFRSLPMRQRFGIVRYLSAPIRFTDGRLFGTLAVLADSPGAFTEQDTDLLMLVAALVGSRIETDEARQQSERKRPEVRPQMRRLVTQQLGEPLALLRGYADMLSRDEIPAAQMAQVARRVATQSATLLRVVDHMLLLSRLPLELTLTVRVPLEAVLQAAAQTFRDEMEAAGTELRLQLDATGEVWGDAGLLQAALEEMLQNVCKHAPTATVVQLRLRQPARDRFQLIVKDNGPGISAEHLAELFDPSPSERAQLGSHPRTGLGLRLVREVAEAHGGSAWANSVEGKGTTFYLELPAASPDGAALRAARPLEQTSA